MAEADFRALRQYLESDLRQPPFADIRGRRSRRSRLLAMTGAALAILVVTVWSVAAPRQNAHNPPVGPSPTAEPSPTVSSAGPDFPFESSDAFPARVVLAGPDAPLLPTEQSVGNAAFVFGHAQLANDHLVTRDGRVFQVPGATGTATMLSPDGRWLGLVQRDGLVLRDLTGTMQRATGLSLDQAWSSDGRYLLGHRQRGWAVLDTQTWTLWTLAGDGDPHPFGVLDTGEVVALDGTPTAGRIPVQIIDSANGSTVRRLVVLGGGHLLAGETLTKPGGDLRVDLVDLRVAGEYGVVRVNDENQIAAAYLVFSPADGRVLRRIDAPAQFTARWALTGTHLSAIDSRGSQAGRPGTDYIVTVNLRDGRFSTVSRLDVPGDSGYFLPGNYQPD